MKIEITERHVRKDEKDTEGIVLGEGYTLKDGETIHEIFVAIQKSKIPHNLTQVGTWVARAFRDKGFRVVCFVECSATSDFSMATAVAVTAPWEGERVKYRWSAEARARANGVVVTE